MTKLPEITDYEASFLKEASLVSSAVHTYIEQKPSIDSENNFRYTRNQKWLRAALASLQGQSSEAVCLFWSQTADELLQKAFVESFANQDIALFAFGKLGSNELNLSSDVDILLVSNEGFDWQASLRKFQKLLGERNSYGFVFRLDFDLRPGGRNGPLVPTTDQLKDYYGNYGETWERLAFVRLRFITGDPTIQTDVMHFAQKFTYRRHLDFTLLEDLKNLRQKIHAHYWTRTQKDQIDLKLGIGGIRDIELFVHALQVVHGGKDKSLQIATTHGALKKIAEKNLLSATEVNFLLSHYWNLRMIENYVQALNDEQTHILNLNSQYPEFIQKQIGNLTADLHRCDTLVSTLLGHAPLRSENSFDLKKLNVSEQIIEDYWQDILCQEALSHTKERDEVARIKFLEEFLTEVHSQKGDVNRAIILLKDFIRATRAKATFFSLLLRERKLLTELAWLFGHSPYLSRILCHRPELLDSFVYRSQDKISDDWSLLLEELSEKKLLSEVINGSAFLRHNDILKLTENLSSTADAVVLALLERLKTEYPTDMKVLALGKWGGREMGFNSDLDFIFVASGDHSENDSKLSRRMISRLTDAHKGGSIYLIDMRLRPSGKAGPLVISEKNLEIYLRDEASAWERQAYLKARWIGGEGIDIRGLCTAKSLSKSELIELHHIQQELSKKALDLDLKYSPGGLIDIEFAAQIYCLDQKRSPKGSSTLDFLDELAPHSASLTRNYLRLRQIEQMLQLVASEHLTKLDQNHESFPFLAIALQVTPQQLKIELSSLFSESLHALNELDPRRRPH